MKRWLAQTLIKMSLDDDRPVPQWVEEYAEKNPDLIQMRDEQDDLIAQLRADAADWKSNCAPPAPPSNARRSSFSTVALAIAAVALLAVGLRLGLPPQTAPPQQNVAAFEVDDVRDALDRSERTARKLNGHVAKMTDSLPVATPAELGRMTREYVQEAGSVFGRSLAMLDRAGR